MYGKMLNDLLYNIIVFLTKKNWFANIYIVIYVKIILYGLPNRS